MSSNIKIYLMHGALKTIFITVYFGFDLTSFSLKNILLINMKKRHKRVFIIICFSQICCLFESGIYICLLIYIQGE